jgi:hypothetical protein
VRAAERGDAIMRFCNYGSMGMWDYGNVRRAQSQNSIISQSHNSTIPQCYTRIVAKLEEILPLCERLKGSLEEKS